MTATDRGARTAVGKAEDSAPVAARARWRFTVEQYHRMAKAGILGEADRVELIDGELIAMTPIGKDHANRVRNLNRLFSRRVGDAAIVDIQNPIVIGDDGEPQPDVALLRPRADFYGSAHPAPADVLLLIEVADSTLSYDRDTKMPLYARGGVPEAWIVDLQHDALLVFRDPTPAGYRMLLTLRRGERVSLVAFPDWDLSVEEILG